MDHPYCVKSSKGTSSSATGTKAENALSSGENSPAKPPLTVTEATGTPTVSPRKSARISLRRDPEGETKAEVEGTAGSVGFVGAVHPGIVQPGFVGAVHPGIVQPEHAGVGRGRGRGRKSLIPEETPVNIRSEHAGSKNACIQPELNFMYFFNSVLIIPHATSCGGYNVFDLSVSPSVLFSLLAQLL